MESAPEAVPQADKGRSEIRQWTSEEAALGREPMELEVRPDQRVGAAIGGMFFCALVIVLAGRVAWGAPARASFRSGTATRKAVPGGSSGGAPGWGAVQPRAAADGACAAPLNA
jgi:hypothetical protein